MPRGKRQVAAAERGASPSGTVRGFYGPHRQLTAEELEAKRIADEAEKAEKAARRKIREAAQKNLPKRVTRHRAATHGEGQTDSTSVSRTPVRGAKRNLNEELANATPPPASKRQAARKQGDPPTRSKGQVREEEEDDDDEEVHEEEEKEEEQVREEEEEEEQVREEEAKDEAEKEAQPVQAPPATTPAANKDGEMAEERSFEEEARANIAGVEDPMVVVTAMKRVVAKAMFDGAISVEEGRRRNMILLGLVYEAMELGEAAEKLQRASKPTTTGSRGGGRPKHGTREKTRHQPQREPTTPGGDQLPAEAEATPKSAAKPRITAEEKKRIKAEKEAAREEARVARRKKQEEAAEQQRRLDLGQLPHAVARIYETTPGLKVPRSIPDCSGQDATVYYRQGTRGARSPALLLLQMELRKIARFYAEEAAKTHSVKWTIGESWTALRNGIGSEQATKLRQRTIQAVTTLHPNVSEDFVEEKLRMFFLQADRRRGPSRMIVDLTKEPESSDVPAAEVEALEDPVEDAAACVVKINDLFRAKKLHPRLALRALLSIQKDISYEAWAEQQRKAKLKAPDSPQP